jgi:putative chitinase
VREIWGPTPAQTRYEGRRDLGNVHPGDGYRYRGRGLIQTTGRANYAATTLGLRKVAPDAPDFELKPEALEAPRWAALSAAWFWASKGLNELADAGDYMRITRRINGGTNGYEDRLALWEQAKAALGVTA